MNYLSVENLTKSFADRLLFADLTFGIDQGQKVAIVAKNGSGKTTLLRCLMDLEQIDSGRVVYRNDIRVAFMEQTENMDESQTILESIFDHDLPELKALKKYNEALIDNDQDKLNECYEELTELNAWDYEVRVNQILSVLKLTDSRRLISSLSGGQKKRVALAKTLLSEADFMILDEPTNHLDLDMIEWLESYLSTSKSTLLMVTHDRYFLEVVCDTIFELSEETLYQYKGNFSYYLEKKAEREEQMQSTIDKARNTFRKELDWIRRQPKARSTKSKSRVDAFDDIKKTAHQRIDKDEIEIPIKMERLGTKILELHHMRKAYGETKILNDFSYHFKRKERVGIVGQNGAGKTTFLNLIQNKEPLDKGKVVVGETIVFGYYSQELIQVDPNKRVIEVIKDIAEFIPLEKGKQLSAAQLLERFLFSRDAHYQYVHKLSGGEKRRLKLLTVLMSNPNFLILDEPTNDLDIFVMSVLEDYLQLFEGCLIVVSHDRYFMDKMVDHLFVFEGDGEIKDIIGNYTDYRKNQKLEARELKNNPPKEVVIKEQPAFVEKPVEKRKLSFKEKQEYENLPNEIEQLESAKERLTLELSDGSSNNQQIMEIGNQLAKVVAELEQKSDRWLELAEFV
ncbi:MAG: ABC-F family ATP-binding cassette domain-containing protein [Crocinitomicaceae bacterium]|nr:ABC-F family ATP-binding cassette domain-containing protein [Crocinitomicaceae bacterium]MCF8410973.1 ABC-F family ATP-binding cassette domain-containing protein [Crocinitomicaceae bacterium]MCF8445088.1 ABC-F family ATP-binding cassette domain-containing protein [Crocinitomicaceae bacterium]